jgi:hypothetical protein
MSLTFSERDIERSIRWTEVHTKKLLSHMHKYSQDALDEYLEYEYEHDHFSISIQFARRCLRRDRWIRCTHHSDECNTMKWVPRIMMYISSHQDDILFTLDIHNESELPEIRIKFEEQRAIEHQLCACGRLGKTDHLVESEHGKCNTCYIYGFVRGDMCPICMEDDGKPWVKTSCGHYFHDMCWYNIEYASPYSHTRKCPMCRCEQNSETISFI